jgi:hypothetical protein
MEKKPPPNAFEEVHKKSQAFRDSIRKASEKASGTRDQHAQQEATREGFDRAATDRQTPQDDEVTQ